jgi:hypothetical protein
MTILIYIEGKCDAVIDKMKLGMDFNISFDTIPIEALVHQLCVIPDSGGDIDIYFVGLPNCNWSQFFGERIINTTNI